ncbi:CHAD domain-containing protein [Thioalkalivibrio sp.]|uniref:CHAD domain-containing protein n=1 Tax=Thioalkalivibrio sp. TaxID=2093813 RepID=UPI0012D641C9|nr:CHAD domain-containing protein [Thioalkalivibrio sp.]TVP80862.1 MAG: CHAD domain-containing protein [Thioalkalivibrio sp.]
MPYHLKRKEPVADGIRRIALEQMERARDELGDEDMASAEAVHQARKRLKKIRALLRLVRPLLGKTRYRAENRRFRDLGRALSGPRDAEVMVATLEVLREDLPAAQGVLPFAGLYEHLVAARDAAYQDSGTLDEHKAEVAKTLAEARSVVAEWPLKGHGFAILGPGLKRAYRRGRKTLDAAMADPTDSRFHDWRKRAKDHWYHSRLLKKAWPDIMGCRARALKELSDLLGDDHDLAVFNAMLDHLPDAVATTSELDRLRHRVVERQATLRRQAVALGRRVYAEKPGPLSKRLSAYWRVWRT